MLRFIVGPVIILLGVAMCGKSISMENYAETLSFRVLLNDVEVGWHTFQLSNQGEYLNCLLYTSPSPRDRTRSRMPSSA